MRHAAAISCAPMAFLFLLWSWRTYALTRGPAGAMGALLLMIPALLCVGFIVWIYRVKNAPFGRLAAGMVTVYGLIFMAYLALLPAVRARYTVIKEEAARDALRTLRAGIEASRKDTGAPPGRPSEIVGRYLDIIPRLILPGTPHPMTREVEFVQAAAGVDTGKWLYVNNPSNPYYGQVRINCTHTDSSGALWSGY